MADKQTLYLVDGTALVYRSHFAFIRNPLINSRGENTSAAYGLVNTLLGLIRDYDPDYLAVVFDTPGPTFRHKRYPDYKATREKMPDELADQLIRTREVVDVLGIRLIELAGYEADDVIGTMAIRGADAGMHVVMVTGDKDFMQLVDDDIRMYIPMKNEELGPEEVIAKTGVPPEKIVDLMGLTGDASDNVPGVPRVGPKTALGLIERFGSLDAVLDGAEEIAKPSIRDAVSEHRDQALLSRELVTIRTDAPVECTLDELRFTGVPQDRALAFFREMVVRPPSQ